MKDRAVRENKSGYCCKAVSVCPCVCAYSYLPECPCKYLWIYTIGVCLCAGLCAHVLFVCLRSTLNFEHAYESVLFISAFACNRLGFNANMLPCAYMRAGMCVCMCVYVCVCVCALSLFWIINTWLGWAWCIQAEIPQVVGELKCYDRAAARARERERERLQRRCKINWL